MDGMITMSLDDYIQIMTQAEAMKKAIDERKTLYTGYGGSFSTVEDNAVLNEAIDEQDKLRQSLYKMERKTHWSGTANGM